MHLCAAAAALLLTGFGPPCTPPAAVELLTAAQGQEEDAWCWAAAGALVMNFLHKDSDVQQCDEVDRQYGAATRHCCADKAACSSFRGNPRYSDYKFSSQSQKTLTWDEIRARVGCLHKPVPFVWTKPGNAKHMMVITGYMTDDQGVRHVQINDPMPVGKGQLYYVTYEEYNPTYGKYALTDNDDVTYVGK